jgi:hypothetical protein
VSAAGFEPVLSRLTGRDVLNYHRKKRVTHTSNPFEDALASPTGFEPVLSRLTGRDVLNYHRKEKGLLIRATLLKTHWRPQPDLNRCYRRERPVSWTWLDDGDVMKLNNAWMVTVEVFPGEIRCAFTAAISRGRHLREGPSWIPDIRRWILDIHMPSRIKKPETRILSFKWWAVQESNLRPTD